MSNIKWNFINKNVLIIGGSRGIGKEVVDSFNKSGANVWKVDSKNCDISNKEEIEKYFDDTNFSRKDKKSHIDILVNVAAINYIKKINQVSFEEWNEVLNINLRGYFYIIKQALNFMSDGGRIVNVSSIAGRHRSLVSGVHYTSSKAGIIGLTKQLAYELGSKNITVNAVCPSQTKTDMLVQTMTKKALNDLGKTIPLKRIATVKEVADSILFLCSDEASYITGTTLDINGGQL